MMSFKKVFLCLVTAALSFSIAGCGSKSSEQSSDSSINQRRSHPVVEKVIGQEGGKISEGDEVEITIPQGALSESTTISVQYVEDEVQVAEAPSMGFLGAFEFGPAGTTFDKPVEVSFKVEEAPRNDSLSIFYFDKTYDTWSYITDAKYSNGRISFTIDHFSKYQVLDLTPDMYLKYVDLVYDAFLNGKSDAWVSETYEDYLINEKHVMDYYQQYGEYWYEPCGLFVYGKYLLNGKDGDQEQLTIRVGESNKKGNTYCVSTVGGLTSSKQTYENARKNATETTQIVDVTIVLDYKMITPKIDCTASDTTLSKGDSASVSVYCHYPKATNTIYPDLALPNYRLTLPNNLSHLKLDKTELTTNSSGKANFTVTSKDGKAETVTITFDASNEGVHAEGKVSFSEDGKVNFAMNGHIIETWDYEYAICENKSTTTHNIKGTNGTVSLRVEYDFDGTIGRDETGFVRGKISYSNVSADISTSRAAIDDKYESEDEAEGSYRLDHRTTSFDVFIGAQMEINTISDVEFFISEYDGYQYTMFQYYFRLPEYFIHVTGTGYDNTHIHTRTVERKRDYDDTNDYDINKTLECDFDVLFVSPMLANFPLEEGTHTMTEDFFKDIDYNGPFNVASGMRDVNETKRTSQTITLVKM